MQPHQERVVAEKAELDNKRGKLAAFVGTEPWRNLDEDEKGRLERQLEVMNEYSEILGDRIAAF
jgi:hypothetical protein